MRALKPIHIAAGIIGLIVFVLSGQYMAIFLKGLADMPVGPRLLYRTSHLYVMWAALLNLVIGVHYAVAAERTERIMQIVASVLLLAALPLFLLGFALESSMPEISRPYCGVGNYFSLAGVILYVFASRKRETTP